MNAIEINNYEINDCPVVVGGKRGVRASLNASFAWLRANNYIELPRTKLTQVLVNTALDGKCMRKIMHYSPGGSNTPAHYRYEVVAKRSEYDAALSAVPPGVVVEGNYSFRDSRSKALRGFARKYHARWTWNPENSNWVKSGWVGLPRRKISVPPWTRIQAEILRRRCPAAWSVAWDTRHGAHYESREPHFVEIASGETYHVSNWTIGRENIRDSRAWDRAVGEAREAFSRRRIPRRNAELDAYLAVHPVQVTVSDSITAGNCEFASEEYRRRWSRLLGGLRIKSVRSDLILKDRDDNYTRRACRAAAISAGARD